ncbi:MAG TPA: ribonuclease HIII [Pseudogracilibacillus sp.]|nr:ribonuclease HIII [Pseudogracilibacillus sp.]
MKTIQKMKNEYKNYMETTPPHAVFRAKTPYAVITAYQSGKVLFQGTRAAEEVRKWGKAALDHSNKKNEKPTHEKQPPQTLFDESHIGSDESGTGDYFGPITNCAMFVPQDKMALLKEIGVQDSKTLTDEKIKELATYLLAMDMPYSLMVLKNEKYNQLQKQGWSQGKMKAMLHDACIKNVQAKMDKETSYGILIDQFCMPHVYEKHITSEGRKLDPHTYFMTKAETHSLAVAAASIIARASFVKEMEDLSKMVGFPLLKGASPKVDQQIAKIIRTKGKQFLPSVAKVHFANTKKAEKLV